MPVGGGSGGRSPPDVDNSFSKSSPIFFSAVCITDFCCLPPHSTHLLQPLDVAFFAPLKRAWQKILDTWKTSNRNTSATLNKNAFPRLLCQLHLKLFSNTGTNDHSDNLVSGFKACGIIPFQPEMALTKLPDFAADINVSSASAGTSTEAAGGLTPVQQRVSDAVLGVLKAMRGANDTVNQQRQRRRKVNVTPGKGVTPEDMETDSDETDTEMSLDDSSECSTESETEESDNVATASQSSFPVIGTTNSCSRDDDTTLNAVVGEFVIVTYEGANFPGKVTEVDEEGARVSTLIKCSRGKDWQWPTPVDEIDYRWEQIVKQNITLISLNKRRQFRVPDLESEWGV